jgi:Zn-dependent peptidase ImmA (M78 family)
MGVRVGFSRDMARRVLRQYDATEPPVDVHRIAIGEGLELRVIDTWSPSLSGLLLRAERLIGINGKHPRTRQRFSLAHELGHWFMRHDFPWHEEEITIDNPPDMMSYGKHPIEGEADEFAGELLVPRAMLKAKLTETSDPQALADIFAVSTQALWVRLDRNRLL